MINYSRQLKTLRIQLSKHAGYKAFPASIQSIQDLLKHYRAYCGQPPPWEATKAEIDLSKLPPVNALVVLQQQTSDLGKT